MTVNAVGESFVRGVAARDRTALLGLLSPEVDFRALTPGKFWESTSSGQVVDEFVLGTWFEESDHVDEVEEVVHDQVADRSRVGYRFRITNPDGAFVLEQQAYYAVEDGRITWLRVLCSGYRPQP